MYKLGKKSQIIGANQYIEIFYNTSLNRFPELPPGDYLIGGLSNGLDEMLYWCENLKDMIDLYERYLSGRAPRPPKWYRTTGTPPKSFRHRNEAYQRKLYLPDPAESSDALRKRVKKRHYGY
jgi:hypothetical protein